MFTKFWDMSAEDLRYENAANLFLAILMAFHALAPKGKIQD